MSQNSNPPAGWYPIAEEPGRLRYWDGAAWTEHRSEPGVRRSMDASTPVATPKPTEAAAVKQARARRPLWQFIVAGVVLFLVGVGVGSAGGSGAQADLQTANGRVKSLSTQLEAAKGENDSLSQQNADLTTQANESRATAQNAVAAARKQVDQQYKAKLAALKSRSNALDARSRSLDQRERKVSGMEHSWAANTIPGEGVFLVGKDIQPGIYKANASSGCYYARLSSLNTTDIIDNNNVDGPVVLQVMAGDKALELSGCAEFHKVG